MREERKMTQQKIDVYCWAIGDLHYRALQPWRIYHKERMDAMFTDLHSLWQIEGKPAFCASPGDLIETCAQENYALAQSELKSHLADLPFYPGIGNHEYYGLDGEDPRGMAETFSNAWGKPVRYTWAAGGVGCIMLDYPNPFTLENPNLVYLSSDTLTFLDTALGRYKDQPVVVFLHCPLSNTVLDRDAELRRDYHSGQHFFSAENSQDVRNILAHHKNACLFVGGHTHSGWEAPNLVVTEQIGGQPVTFVNLMSPWYTGMHTSTGTHTGPQVSEDRTSVKYIPDEPNVIPSFAFRIHPDHINIRVREHRTRTWLKEWNVPMPIMPITNAF
jgi:Calcineurin-like phosphoesterase